MNIEILSALALGAITGGAIGGWRTWAFARKLLHFGISLDAWSDYDERNRQAHGQSRRENVTRFQRDSER